MNKTTIIALLSVMMVCLLAVPAAATTWDVYEGDSIQDALNNASDGDTVFVHEGTYLLTASPQWGLVVNTPNITLKGEGADKVTLDGNGILAIYLGPTGYAFSGPAQGCIVEGFRIINASSGIAVNDNSPNCIIRNNVIKDIPTPIGTLAPNTTIAGNVMDGASKYIEFRYGPVTFIDNVVSNSTKTYASVKFYIPDAVIVNNTFRDNVAGMGIYNNEATNITVVRNNFISSGAGIRLYDGASGNRIYLNNFVDNTESVSIGGSVTPINIWNSTEPIEYVYDATTYTNYLGNYWSDYGGVDTSPVDGIGDSAYQIATSTDYDFRPLVAPFEDYPAPIPQPDLTPTAITAPTLFAGEPNTISATIANTDTLDAGAFSVSLSADGAVVDTASVASLGAGANTDVSFTWTPAGAGTYNLCVVADSGGDVDESDEANNETCETVDVVTPNATVFFEPGASGANYDETTTVGVWVDTSEVIKGGTIVFDYTVGCANVTGYTASTTTDWDFMNNGNLNVPGTVKIGFGTLKIAGKGPGLLHIGDLDIRCDCESYCETGLIWDLTPGTPPASYLERLGLLGLLTPVKWDDGTFACTNLPDLEIIDMFGKQTSGDNYIVHYTVKNKDDATANAPADHTTTLYIDGIVKEHIVVPVALAPGESYNGTFTELTMTGANDQLKVCADNYDEVMELDETNNCVESIYPAGIELSVIVLNDSECVDFQEQFLVNINIDPRNIPVYGIEYVLTFDNSALHAEWQNEGTFLNSDGKSTNMYINTIDNGAGTISFAATRIGNVGGIANPPGTLAVIKFTAIQLGASSNLTLSDVVAANADGAQILPLDLNYDEVCVSSNKAPVAIGKSMHKYNNDGQKYICKAYFNGTASNDPDGSLVNWRWSFGDGNYGAGELVDHVYQSWKWNGTGYEPFNVSLTVTDDGEPNQLDNTTFFDVMVYTAGDANGDGKVNILDATIVGLEWGKTTDCSGAYCWIENERGSKADLNNDRKVNILDAVIIGTCWGHTA